MAGYLRLQLDLVRATWRERFAPLRDNVPPPRLRHRVHGSIDHRGYLEVGQRSWRSIEQLLEEIGRPADTFDSILDYGCGSGRVARVIPKNTSRGPRTITAIDIDATAIAWCARHLPGIQFLAVPPNPPTPLPDAAFDLIFAVSVFTHLDETMQFAILDEMRRLLRPDGVLVASVQGDYHRRLRKRQFDLSRGFTFVASDRGWFKKDGLPRFYQDAQHTRGYVERTWSATMDVRLYRERGICDYQDAVVLVRRP